MRPPLGLSDMRILDDEQGKKKSSKVTSLAAGGSQTDYMRRLARRVKSLDRRMRAEGEGRIRAIGVLGSDVYDKLLVLRALREDFPGTVFFTTDLDARFSHSSELQWTRNLIVASSYGLSLHADHQRDIPPFRDSYQTALYYTTLPAVGAPGLQEGQERYDILNKKPRLFEIGHRGAVDITPNTGPQSVAFHPERIDGRFAIFDARYFWAVCFLPLVLASVAAILVFWGAAPLEGELALRLRLFAWGLIVGGIVVSGSVAVTVYRLYPDGFGPMGFLALGMVLLILFGAGAYLAFTSPPPDDKRPHVRRMVWMIIGIGIVAVSVSAVRTFEDVVPYGSGALAFLLLCASPLILSAMGSGLVLRRTPGVSEVHAQLWRLFAWGFIGMVCGVSALLTWQIPTLDPSEIGAPVFWGVFFSPLILLLIGAVCIYWRAGALDGERARWWRLCAWGLFCLGIIVSILFAITVSQLTPQTFDALAFWAVCLSPFILSAAAAVVVFSQVALEDEERRVRWHYCWAWGLMGAGTVVSLLLSREIPHVSRLYSESSSPPWSAFYYSPSFWIFCLLPVALAFVLIRLMILRLNSEWQIAKKAGPYRRRGLLCFTAALLLSLLMMLAIKAAYGGGEGEPWSLDGGISIWPTEVLRLAVFVLSVFFLLLAKVEVQISDNRINRFLFDTGQPDSQTENTGTWRKMAELLTQWNETVENWEISSGAPSNVDRSNRRHHHPGVWVCVYPGSGTSSHTPSAS